ncbi:Lactoylglutathione lyase [Ascosphaera pollenicola]|nr:Lactoylglutathione lyase [Ascosphaera pollenicola]
MSTDPSLYKLNHSMIRVKDPARSLAFYKALGLTQINQFNFPENKFSLYFLAYDGPGALQKGAHWSDRNGVVELTHNHGTEHDENYQVVNGNTEPHKGFGHLCISVDNIGAACKRLEEQGWSFQKKLVDGRMKSIAFVKDPDGYWIEIIRQSEHDKSHEDFSAVKTEDTNPDTYRLNHTMLRVKDIDASLKFYTETLGMTLLRTSKHPSAEFDLYFLAYPASQPAESKEVNPSNPYAGWEGILELTYNYGTEKQEGPVYHNGNTEPQGFGHICISVDNLDAACARFEEKGASWKKRLTDGRMKDVAFLMDPDGYWVEVIQNDRYKKSNL